MSRDPRIWGPTFWSVFHTVAFWVDSTPTRAQRDEIERYYHTFGTLLPCVACRDHYTELLRTMPVRAGSRAELIRWTIDVHNAVNARLGKPTVDPAEAIARIAT